MCKQKASTPSPQQQAYCQALLQPVAKKRGRRPAPGKVMPSEETLFSRAFKDYQDTEDYRALYYKIREGKTFIVHLIWLAYRAGFLAGRKRG